MAIREELILMMLENCPGWASTAEGFLDFILITDYLSQLALENTEEPRVGPSVLELGNAFLKVACINLGPYESFEQLCLVQRPTGRIRKKANAIIRRAIEKEDIARLIEESEILPCEDTIKTEVLIDIMATQLITRLRVYIDIV